MAKKKALGYDTTSPVLRVFLYDRQIGTIGQHGSDVWFKYDEWVIDDETPDQWRLSIKLPVQADPFGHEATLVFFDNLLIESDTRAELAAATKHAASDITGLLGRVGGECAGAVSLWPIGMEPPRRPEYRSISTTELEDIFAERHGQRLSKVQLESRQVMSGVQHKLVLRKSNNAYSLPLHGAPGTDLIKRSTGRYDDLALNELFCLRVMNELALDSPLATLVGGPNGLLDVVRYDRVVEADDSIRRIHQEDFCQATGRIVARKYQRHGGPGFGDIAEVLRQHSINPPEDIRRLIGVALANVCLGNMDAHAKNFSILYGDKGPRLAPFYDIVSTEAYDGLDMELSMRFGHATDPRRITRADFERLAKDLRVGVQSIDDEAHRIIGLLENSISALIADVETLAGPTEIPGRIGDTVRSRLNMLSRAASRTTSK